jgi:hypothetical protein
VSPNACVALTYVVPAASRSAEVGPNAATCGVAEHRVRYRPVIRALNWSRTSSEVDCEVVRDDPRLVVGDVLELVG